MYILNYHRADTGVSKYYLFSNSNVLSNEIVTCLYRESLKSFCPLSAQTRDYLKKDISKQISEHRSETAYRVVINDSETEIDEYLKNEIKFFVSVITEINSTIE